MDRNDKIKLQSLLSEYVCENSVIGFNPYECNLVELHNYLESEINDNDV